MGFKLIRIVLVATIPFNIIELQGMKQMITVEIQPQLEKDFKAIVQKFYNGDECATINEAVKIT